MKKIQVPVKEHDGHQWGCLQILDSGAHYVVAEKWEVDDPNYTFVGQHRVRKLKLKANVHFRIPVAVAKQVIDIKDLPGATAPRRQGGR